ncbi:MAG: UvrD-helicase domain-containing protein [Planctomycetota bacterium]
MPSAVPPSPTDPLLAGLTEPQAAAATHVDGPMLVLAGPGSGKTRVITRRIAHLVRGVGIAPWNVLAITFTNKAAGEMRDRVAALLTEKQARAATVATFHSLCARLIRQYADRLGLPPGYSIYDTADQKRAIKQALEDLEINTKNFPPASMLGTISNAKNDLLDAAAYAKQATNFYDRTVAKVYTKYESILERNAALDFDDLLLKTVQLFKKNPDVLEEKREHYQYVMIDEYQDTNHAQFMIANALASEHQNIVCTGDPDQSIYGWRGANIQNILEFEQHYPAAEVVRLEQNYRSTKKILAAADGLIVNNRGRRHKTLWTDNPEGEPVRVVSCLNEKQEASWVAEEFQRLHDDEQVAWGQMAVFYRINSLSRVMEETLRHAGVPYQIARGTAFYDRKEIKDAVAYLRVVANPSDEVNLLRVINTPARGISAASVKALQAAALADNVPIDALLGDPLRVTALNARAQTSVAKFGKTVDRWRTTAGVTGDAVSVAPLVNTAPSLRSFVEDVLRESGLETYYRNDKSDPDHERLANLGELVTSAQQFEEEYDFNAEQAAPGSGDEITLREKLLAFLEQISLVSDADSVDPEQGAVTLMTLHAAKGLEYPVVAMLGVEDGLLPHERANGDDSELEEERRLAFVGITRAERRLYLCHGKSRTVFGQTMPTIRSRFLSELPEEAVELLDPSSDPDAFDDPTFTSGGDTQRSLAARRAGVYPPGTLVKHPQFGTGRVVQVSPMGAHTRAKIDFTTAGTKTLILQYARLEVIDV